MQPFRPALLLAALFAASALSGCQKPLQPIAEAPPALPPHLGPPPAAQCTVAPFKVEDGGTAAISMTVSNDGGYCAAALTSAGGQPFDAPLVPIKPQHGDETVVRYNGKTSIEYSARAGYAGHDSFVVKLILKGRSGYTTLNVGIDVQGTGNAAKTS